MSSERQAMTQLSVVCLIAELNIPFINDMQAVVDPHIEAASWVEFDKYGLKTVYSFPGCLCTPRPGRRYSAGDNPVAQVLNGTANFTPGMQLPVLSHGDGRKHNYFSEQVCLISRPWNMLTNCHPLLNEDKWTKLGLKHNSMNIFKDFSTEPLQHIWKDYSHLEVLHIHWIWLK